MRSFFHSLRRKKKQHSTSPNPWDSPSSSTPQSNLQNPPLRDGKSLAFDKRQEAARERKTYENDRPPAYDYTQPPSHPPPPVAYSRDSQPPALGSLGDFQSPANNATEWEYNQGVRFCDCHPIDTPMQNVSPQVLGSVNDMMFVASEGSGMGVNVTAAYESAGKNCRVIRIHTEKDCKDTTLLSKHPLYFAGYHHPSMLPAAEMGYKTVFYYEVDIVSLSPWRNWKRGETPLMAIGYSVAPYPGFRLPGWHRGSLAIHSDDGHRYCNDCLGGIQFTSPFKAGETIGIGMVFTYSINGATGNGKVDAEVIFLRNGVKQGGWMVNEELDAKRVRTTVVDGIIDPKFGLMGDRDVYAAVGVCGQGIDLCVRFFDSNAAREILLGV